MSGQLDSNGRSKHISFIGSDDQSSNIQSLEMDGISKKLRRLGKSISRSNSKDSRPSKPITTLTSTKPYGSADTVSLGTNSDAPTNTSTLCEYPEGCRPQKQRRQCSCSCSGVLRTVCQCLLGVSLLIMFSMASVTFMAGVQHCFRKPIFSNLSLGNKTWANASHGVSQSPTFLTYMLTSGMSLMLPVILLWPTFSSSEEDGSEKTSLTDFLFVLSQDRRDWRLALSRTFLLSCLWLAYVYALIRSLGELPLIDCVVLICTSPCYLYIFKWIILHKKFLASRIVAFVISSCGTILLIYLDQKLFASKVLATFAVVTQAFFTVIRRGLIGGNSIFRNTAFYTTVGIFCCLSCWPIVIFTCVVTNAEEVDWRNFPWPAFAIAFSAFQVAVLMQELSSPVHSTVIYRLEVLGMLPISFGVEIYRNRIELDLNRSRIASILLVCTGALVAAVPLKFYKKIGKLCNKSNKTLALRPPLSSDRRASTAMVGALHRPTVRPESGHELDSLKVSRAARSLLSRQPTLPDKGSRLNARSRFLGVIYQNSSDAV